MFTDPRFGTYYNEKLHMKVIDGHSGKSAVATLAFNQVTNIFTPRYHQTHVSSIKSKIKRRNSVRNIAGGFFIDILPPFSKIEINTGDVLLFIGLISAK